MPCINPKPAWKVTLPNKNGKYPISFDHRDRKADYWIGCNKCDGCTHSKKLEWAIRMHHENMSHSQSCFLTLTYRNAPDKINRYDCQTFLKRLRHHLDPLKIRYFITGEYGQKTRRPHYHAILFNTDFLGNSYSINEQLYGNERLNRIWGHGDVTIGNFTIGSAMYVAGYTAKKINDKDTFSIMSKNPPIGAEWLKLNYKSILLLEKVIVSGQEYPIPSAYLRWLAGDSEIQKLKERRPEQQRLTDLQLDSK